MLETNENLIERLLSAYNCMDAVNARELYACVTALYTWVETLGTTNIKKEVPAEWLHNGQLVKGMIDMLVETEDIIYIIDYKTYNPETPNDDAYKKKARSYATQLSYYRQIVSKAYPGKEVKAGIYFVFAQSMYWLDEVKEMVEVE